MGGVDGEVGYITGRHLGNRLGGAYGAVYFRGKEISLC